jgi:hypothetical protein
MHNQFQCIMIKVSSSKVLHTDINDLIQHHHKLNLQTALHPTKRIALRNLPTSSVTHQNLQLPTTLTTQNNLLQNIFLPSTACT